MKKRFPYLPTGSHITGSSTKEGIFEGNTFDEKKHFEMGIVFEMKSGKIKVHSRMLVTKRAPNIRKTGLYQIMRKDMVW